PFTVVGVAARGFAGIDLGQEGEAWVTMSQLTRFFHERDMLESRNAQWIRVVGRLRAGLSIEAARARVAATGARLAQSWKDSNEGTSASLEPLAGGLEPNNRREGIPIF